MFGKEAVPGFEELLTICRNLYPENRHFVLSIARQILETQPRLSGTAKPAEHGPVLPR